jgi:hypothetical protein
MAGSAAKNRVVYPLQKWPVNPIVPFEHDLGIPSPDDALLEMTGRTRLRQRSPRRKSRGIRWGQSKPAGLAWPAGVWVAGR